MKLPVIRQTGLALGLMVATFASGVSALPAPAVPSLDGRWSAAGPGIVANETWVAGEDIYIVRHQAPSLAQYRGQIPGLAATSLKATGGTRLDTNSAASVAYLDYLADQHALLQADIEAALGRPIEVVYRYDAVLNGIAVRMDMHEAAVVANLAGVKRVSRDQPRELLTDSGPRWIGADAIWGEDPISGECNGSCGEGVVVGVIDTGINFDHPSFAEVGPVDGYVHTNPRATFLGLCDPVTGAPFCNDKLIGYYDFTAEPGGPDDLNGHGSHTASTAAGNLVDVQLEAPTTTLNRRISGVAPHANIVAYKACGDEPSGILGCFPTLAPLLAAINQATLDQVDVINYSIGGNSGNPWADEDAQAFFDAYSAGIFVATSAGNSGPGAATMGSPADAPWVTAVGASTHDRELKNGIVNMTGGSAPPPADIFGKSLTAPLAAARVVYAGDFAAQSSDPANAHLCGAGVGDPATGEGSGGAPWPAGTFNGEIVVCDRGEYGRVHKGENLLAAGGGGYVLANDPNNGNSLVGDPHVLPAVHITHDDGVILKAWIAAEGATHTGTAEIRGTVPGESPANGDVMAGFSSRGQNPSVPDLIKPDVTAPGVDILAAFHTPLGTPPFGDPEWGIISGTSMSSPHVAGAGALIIGERRERGDPWTPDQVKSALMTTAFTTTPGTGSEIHEVLKEDGLTPADPFDMGGGRVDLRQAADAGFTLEVGAAAYQAADPALGGDASTLNIASLGQDACLGSCSWTRTLKGTAPGTVNWTTTTTTPAGMSMTVSPASFDLAQGATIDVTITADVVNVTPKNEWTFAEVRFTPGNPAVPEAHFPVAVVPIAGTSEILHFHGNQHDGCTGDGAIDLTTGGISGDCTPFLSPDPDLDTVPAAKWGPINPLLDCTVDRCDSDPNWIWELTEPTTLQGPMVVDWWSTSPNQETVFNLDFTIRLFADGALAVEETVRHNVLTPDTKLFSSTIEVPLVTASDNFVLVIDPFFVTQTGAQIFYDSEMACPGATGGKCDSKVSMPVVREPVNDPPVANDDDAFVVNGGTVVIEVLANDFDPDNDPLTLNIVTPPAHGTAEVGLDNDTITYTHDSTNTTSDTLTYRITDIAGQSAEATVFITIANECFFPTGSFSDDVESDVPGYVIEFTREPTWMRFGPDTTATSPSTVWFATDDQPGNPTLTSIDSRLALPPLNLTGDSELSFWHNFDFARFLAPSGADTAFQSGGVIEISADGGANWIDLGAYITTGGYNGVVDPDASAEGNPIRGREAWVGTSSGTDPQTGPNGRTQPMFQTTVDLGAAIGNEFAVGTLEGALVRFRLGGTFQILIGGVQGTGWGIDDIAVTNLLEFDPDCDPNDPPVARPDAAMVNAGGSVNIDVKANDSDPDHANSELTVTIEDAPSHGNAVVQPNGTITYTHNGDGAESDSFTYRLTDPLGAFDIGSVSITIKQPENLPPDAVDDTASVNAGQSVTIEVKANDSDPDHSNAELTVTIETQPAHGTVGVTADGDITYTHNGDGATADSFKYRLTDPRGAFDIATVSIQIDNPAPDAVDDAAIVAAGGSTTIDVKANDSDPNHANDELTVTIETQPGRGAAGVTADGQITYSHNGDGATADSFQYRLTDPLGAFDVATVTITIEHDGGQGEKVTGGGYLATNDGGKINFGFNAKNLASGPQGNLTLNDKDAGIKIKLREVTSLGAIQGSCGSVAAGPAAVEFSGTGTFNGAAAAFRVCVADLGEPGSAPQGSDRFYLACTSGCAYDTGARTADDVIDGGNIQVHGGSGSSQTAAPKASAGEASVLILDPMFAENGATGELRSFSVRAYGADGELMDGAAVTLTIETAAGPVNLQGVSGLAGLVHFSYALVAGEMGFEARSGAVTSNVIEINGSLF